MWHFINLIQSLWFLFSFYFFNVNTKVIYIIKSVISTQKRVWNIQERQVRFYD